MSPWAFQLVVVFCPFGTIAVATGVPEKGVSESISAYMSFALLEKDYAKHNLDQRIIAEMASHLTKGAARKGGHVMTPVLTKMLQNWIDLTMEHLKKTEIS